MASIPCQDEVQAHIAAGILPDADSDDIKADDDGNLPKVTRSFSPDLDFLNAKRDERDRWVGAKPLPAPDFGAIKGEDDDEVDQLDEDDGKFHQEVRGSCYSKFFWLMLFVD